MKIGKYSQSTLKQGNFLKGIYKKIVRREGIEPIKRVLTHVLFSVTFFDKEIKLHFMYTEQRVLALREYRFTHMNCSTVDILFLSVALSAERL